MLKTGLRIAFLVTAMGCLPNLGFAQTKVVEKEVKVPAGTYKAIPVAGQDIEANGVKITRLTYYFAENVGMVKQVIEIENNKIIIELERFEQAKDIKEKPKAPGK